MLKKLLSFSLAALLLQTAGAAHFSVCAQTNQDASRVEKIKKNVAKRGVGEKVRVRVKLRNGSKLRGYISQAGADSFTVVDRKTGQSTTVAYGDAEEVKKEGGLPAVAWIGIGIGAAVGVMAILYGAACGSNDYC